MRSKKLLLCESVSRYPDIKGIDIQSIYRPIPKLLRMVRFLHHKTGFLPSLKKIWLGTWRRDIGNYDNIIMFDSIFDYTPLNYIRKRNSEASIHFCYRNRVQEKIKHEVIKRNPNEIKYLFGCSMWSYSEEDCKQFNLKKYSQFHLIPDRFLSARQINYDAYFIGSDKGRLKDLKQLDIVLKDFGFITKIEIVPSDNVDYSKDDTPYISRSRSYEDVLKMTSEAKCIIDWVVDLNRGLTFRCLEAAVMKKKLITNYVDIASYDFYNPNNVFIWGVDAIEKLPYFINSDFDSSTNSVLERYSFSNFCKTILDK